MKKTISFVVLSAFLATSSFAQAPADQTSAKTIRDRIVSASSCIELQAIHSDLELVRVEAGRIEEDLKKANEVLSSNRSTADALGLTTTILAASTCSLLVSSKLLGGSSAAARAFQRNILSSNSLRKVYNLGELSYIVGVATAGFTILSYGSVQGAKEDVAKLTEKLAHLNEKILLIDEILQHKAKHMRCVLGN